MINFDTEKNGYNKEQVTEYFELVQKEYEQMYLENQNLRSQLQHPRQFADSNMAYDIPPDRMEAIALALVDAETAAQRIVNTAREKAWQILTDAKKGLPISEEAAKAPLPMHTAKTEPAQPLAAPTTKSTREDIDALIDAILGDEHGKKS